MTASSTLAGNCCLCEATDWMYGFQSGTLTYFACGGCGLTRLAPHAVIERGSSEHETVAEGFDVLKGVAALYAAQFRALVDRDVADEPALLVAERAAEYADIYRRAGFRQLTAVSLTEYERGEFPAGAFGTVLVPLQLERARDPIRLLIDLQSALKLGGTLLLVCPLIDSRMARFLGDAWTELRPENRYVFSRSTIHSALWRAGFERVAMRNSWRHYSLAHLYYRARTYPQTRITRLVKRVCGVLSNRLLTRVHVRLPCSAYTIRAMKGVGPLDARPQTLSVVIPVYNERETVGPLLDAVLSKQVLGMRKEVIIVESNSSDGTREAVAKYGTHPGVRIIWEETPRGKGHAVRRGLTHASGDICLIQDADLEYDVNDYEGLVKPILQYRGAFILGSRHSGDWKIRHFNDALVLASFFNLGHLLFLWMFNRLYRQRLSDPFTMFKVFRRDCLFGLQFDANRFDFDFEIVIKLLRKGYQPLEVPVNYRARSMKEGKKVTMVRDPLTWMWALVKYRFVKIDPMASDYRDNAVEDGLASRR